MKRNNTNPLIFIYMDEKGINSLYAQTVDRVESEYTASQEVSKNKKMALDLGSGQLLSFLFGTPTVDAGAEYSTSGKSIQQVKTVLSIEQKLVKITEYLDMSNEKVLFSNLAQAATDVSAIKKTVFVKIRQKFDMPQFINEVSGVDAVNRDKSIAFRIGDSEKRDESDNYYKINKTQYTFIMMAGLDKSTRSQDGMSYTGHDAVFFNAHKGIDVELGVFGYLLFLGKYAFQIKPYAIWI